MGKENDHKDRESEQLEKKLNKLAKETAKDKNKETGQKRGGKKRVILVVVIVLVIAALIFAGYIYFRLTRAETETVSESTDSVNEVTDSVSEVTDSVSEVTDSVSEVTDSVSEVTDSVSEVMSDDKVADTELSDTDYDAAYTNEEPVQEPADEEAVSDDIDTSSEDRELSGWAAAAVAAKEFRTAAAADDIEYVSLDNIPVYSGNPYVFINGNQPFFDDSDYTGEVFETYSDLDELGRCGPAFANLCKELMPTGNREYIRNIYPSGYHNAKYSFIDGEYVYNRCHLIAFSLAGESANEKNLITGTQYLNIEGMYPFEYMVGDYIRRRDNHVLYRVTPIFEGDNLVASGVLIEASSVEDMGEGLNFCVYCYNVQPGVEINYATGRTQSDGTMD